ncbi:MAG: hypothetical protein WD250_07405 [Egibacteraceae bacterium]
MTVLRLPPRIDALLPAAVLKMPPDTVTGGSTNTASYVGEVGL